jgi:hypothetical protein
MVYSVDRQALRVQEKTLYVLVFIEGSPRSVWNTNRMSDVTLADLYVTRRDSFRVAACSVARDIHDISRKTNAFSLPPAGPCSIRLRWT